jgi:hypothetical protein
MRVYTVHERPVARGEDRDVALVKEGFCWPALFVPIIWGLYRRLWLGVLIYVAVVAGLSLAVELGGVDPVTEAALGLGLAILVAAEANDWRRRSLARRGYRPAGLVMGGDLAMAEERFFKLGARAAVAPPPAAPAAPIAAPVTPQP